MRKPTQADGELLLRLYDIRREPELRRARKWFLSEFQPSGWPEIKARYLTQSDEDRWLRMTIGYWEMVGALVNHGVLHAELFFDPTSEDMDVWRRCEPWIEGARADIRPTYLQHLEKMAKDHAAFRARQVEALERRRARAAAGPKTARRGARKR